MSAVVLRPPELAIELSGLPAHIILGAPCGSY
jgi:hypothetical protein